MSSESRAARLFFALVITLAATAAFAQNPDEDRAEFGKNITVAPGQSSGDIACVHCSVYVRGTVNGDVAVFSGRVIVDGTVKGDVAVFMGRVRLDNGSRVGGDIVVFGGDVNRDPTAVVGGDVKAMGMGWVLLPLLLLLVFVSLFIGFIVWLVTRHRRTPPAVRAPDAA